MILQWAEKDIRQEDRHSSDFGILESPSVVHLAMAWHRVNRFDLFQWCEWKSTSTLGKEETNCRKLNKAVAAWQMGRLHPLPHQCV